MIKMVLVGGLFVASLQLVADNKPAANRLSKKDKQDLVEMFVEFVDGMERDSNMPVKEQIQSRWWFWETPMTRIEKSIEQLNQMAQQISNYIVDLNVTQHGDHHGAKQCCKEALNRLEQIEMLLAKLVALLIEQRQTIGSRDDQSVGEQDFNCVAEIDNAELSVISWLKTVYREQLKDKFIS